MRCENCRHGEETPIDGLVHCKVLRKTHRAERCCMGFRGRKAAVKGKEAAKDGGGGDTGTKPEGEAKAAKDGGHEDTGGTETL